MVGGWAVLFCCTRPVLWPGWPQIGRVGHIELGFGVASSSRIERPVGPGDWVALRGSALRGVAGDTCSPSIEGARVLGDGLLHGGGEQPGVGSHVCSLRLVGVGDCLLGPGFLGKLASRVGQLDPDSSGQVGQSLLGGAGEIAGGGAGDASAH